MGKHTAGFWTLDRQAALEKMWSEGAATSVIAERLGITREAAWCRAHSMGLPARSIDTVSWTQDRIETLKALDAEGLSLNQIARRMGVTRNAVAGQRHRLGLTEPSRSPIKKREPGRHRDGEKKAELPMVEVTGRLAGAFGEGDGVGMAEIVSGQCRWPLWGNSEKPTFRCCGRETEGHPSYCYEHQRRSEPSPFNWTPTREAKLERLIREGVTDPSKLANELKAPRTEVETHAALLAARKSRGPRSVAWGRM